MMRSIRQQARLLIKDKATTLLHLLGISTAFTCMFLIYQYISYEISYDRHHPDAEHLYRIYTANYDQSTHAFSYVDAMSFNLSGPALRQELPEVLSFARVYYPAGGVNVKIDNALFHEEGAAFADAEISELFDIRWLQGDPSVLSQKHVIVLTETHARKYFTTNDPLGEVMEITGGPFAGLYRVGGILKDSQHPSHLSFDMLISYPTLFSHGIELNWTSFDNYTYLRLKPGTKPKELNEKILPLSKKYLGSGTTLVFQLQPVTDIHLRSAMAYEVEVNGDIKHVILLGTIMTFAFVIACINCANLLLASAIHRRKEVGIRKVFGAKRSGLFLKFLNQTLILNTLAALFAILVVQIIQPVYREFTGIREIRAPLQDANLGLFGFVMLIASVALSGIFPSIIRSSYTPKDLVNKRNVQHGAIFSFQNSLMLFQFTAAACLLTGTLIVHEQVRFMRSYDTGMNLDQIAVVPITPHEQDARAIVTFKEQIKNLADVAFVTLSSSIPSGEVSNISSISGGIWWDKKITESQFTYYSANVDDEFFAAYAINFLSGHNFRETIASDTTHTVIINESARKLLEFPTPESALGENLNVPGPDGQTKYKVIGVVGDFRRQSLKFDTEPTLYFYERHQGASFLSVKFRNDNYADQINKLEKLWADIMPSAPFTFFFADDAFDALYKKDVQFARVSLLFSLTTIFVACIGLYGLSSYISTRRTKEIGIRKTLGANSWRMFALLSSQFIKIWIASVLLSVPLVIYFSSSWLSEYSESVSVGWSQFAFSGLLLLAIMIATIAFHITHVARLNPVSTIKTEP